jgi:homoserine dehydrogenase
VKDIRLGMAGLGTVAQGVLEIINNNGALISQRTGLQLRVERIVARTARPEVDLRGARFSHELSDLYNDPAIDVVLELIGGETDALDLINQSLLAGKAVVTANKAVIATHGNEILLGNTKAPLKFEAAVAGAIPIIQAVQSGLVANRFEHLLGIINGTSNYILTAMQEQGARFEDALADAQRLGYAEADPTFDVEGVDAAHKLTILLALAFDSAFDFDHVYVEGISQVTPADIRYADELGYRIKHLGIARQVDNGLEARVHPTLIPKEQLLANVNDVMNAILVRSDAAGDTLYSGPGAGGSATASSVLADVVRVARILSGEISSATASDPTRAEIRILPITEVCAPQYLRIPARDEPGVFAHVANVLSNHQISIEAAIQKEPRSRDAIVDIVILTRATVESEVVDAVREVSAIDHVVGPIARIRVEALD